MRLLDTLLDRSVVFSYDRWGFERHRARFDPADLDVDLAGRVCLITGANSGLGLATAEALARLGARVHLLCRDAVRGEEAVLWVKQSCRSKTVYLDLVDVSERSSIRAFVKRFREQRVDVLIHNAAVLPGSYLQTSDGIELTLATNLAGPYLLTHLLMPKLQAAAGGRVIFVSSGGMFTQKLDVEELESEPKGFDGVAAYARTKRALVLLAGLMAEKYASGSVTFNSMHPGWADTPAVRTSLPVFYRLTKGILRSPSEGADTIVWLAASAKAAGVTGGFFFDREPQDQYPLPWTKESPEERKKLWSALGLWAGLPETPLVTASPHRAPARRARG
jgi:NAD(P)-dependent dehydrogenase (short-subunit alcohol dehydrogenase family)